MKLKKILVFVCSLVMVFLMFVVTANATVDGCTATLEFAGYEVKGTTTFAKVNVKATIPDTLSPYKENLADWSTTFEDTYEGQMLQLVGFDIPYVDGLNIITSLTANKAEYVTVTANAKDKKVTLAYNGGEDVPSYYAGTIDTLATLYYQIQGDVNATYNLELTDAVIGIVTVSGNSTSGKVVAPKEYRFNDFTVTNAVVKPAGPTLDVEDVKLAELTADTKNIEFGGKTYTNVAAWAHTFDLAAIKAEYVDAAKGESFIKAGFKSAAKDKWVALPELTGDGEVNAKLIFVGITADAANALDIDAYLQANLAQ